MGGRVERGSPLRLALSTPTSSVHLAGCGREVCVPTGWDSLLGIQVPRPPASPCTPDSWSKIGRKSPWDFHPASIPVLLALRFQGLVGANMCEIFALQVGRSAPPPWVFQGPSACHLLTPGVLRSSAEQASVIARAWRRPSAMCDCDERVQGSTQWTFPVQRGI